MSNGLYEFFEVHILPTSLKSCSLSAFKALISFFISRRSFSRMVIHVLRSLIWISFLERRTEHPECWALNSLVLFKISLRKFSRLSISDLRRLLKSMFVYYSCYFRFSFSFHNLSFSMRVIWSHYSYIWFSFNLYLSILSSSSSFWFSSFNFLSSLDWF